MGRYHLVTVVLVLAIATAAAARSPEALLQAQKLLESEQPEQALDLLDPYLEEHPKSAQGLLLRSTARIMIGEVKGGRTDLERALKEDPALRQGWLNLAALEIAEKNYEEALSVLERARKLDPEAPDSYLNIGAVTLLQGRLGAASEQFERYLELEPGPEAYYLVASNYAIAGYAALAIEHLRQAVRLDERYRLRARTDPNFADLGDSPQFNALLTTDSYRPPPGAYEASRSYPVGYDAEGGTLLGAVIDALRQLREPFDARIEVTPDWALIWGELRIKVTRGAEGAGLVKVSAPAERFAPQAWQRRVDRLFAAIAAHLPPAHRHRADGAPRRD